LMQENLSKIKMKEEQRTQDSTKDIFIPKTPKDFKEDDAFNYLQNIEIEINNGIFSKKELLLLENALYGKFLDKSRRSFFLYHHLPLWVDSIRTLFKYNAHPKIIELGCGTGTSSLLFAMLGAQSIGIELDANLIGICNKRKRFYERQLENLNVEFYQANTFDFHFEDHAPVDAYFSHFAFNLMKPADTLIALLTSSLRVGGKIVIIDGNQSNIYAHLIPSRRRPGVFTPSMMRKEFNRLGYRVVELKTHCAIPPIAFNSMLTRKFSLMAEEIIRFLGLQRFFSVSYTIVAEKS